MDLITNPSDIYYLTWVRPHDPGEILLVLPDKKEKRKKKKEGIILCDPRTNALFDKAQFEIIDQRGEWEKVFSQYKMLETDPDFLTQTLREKIEWYGVTLTMKKSPITERRIIKTPQEIEKLRTAQQMNKTVYEKILPYLVPCVTEAEIARKIQILQLELGATGPSFPPIVAFGEHSAVPHHEVTDRKLQCGDPVLLDMGLVYRWYCSDMTRCIAIQKTKYKRQNDGFLGNLWSFEEIYSLLQFIVETLVPLAKPGVKVSDLDKEARKMMGTYESYFTHSLGHGVGIDIHEAPRISHKSDEILQEWMVITIEPGIYFYGEYGARYEEMVLVTERGGEIL
jgi:Xaa-Pro aminopeptidase